MAFLAVLIVVVADHWLKFSNHIIPKDWVAQVVAQISAHAQSAQAGNGFSGAMQVVLIPTLVTGLVFWLVHAFMGWFAYFVLGLFWLWYLVDFTPTKSCNADNVFSIAYHDIFAKFFWFSVFGPVGLALLYYTQVATNHVKEEGVSEKLQVMLAVLNWVPVRLLGVSFALVGEFSKTRELLQENVQTGLVDASELANAFGNAASGSDDASIRLQVITRSVWLWLVVLALVSIGMLL